MLNNNITALSRVSLKGKYNLTDLWCLRSWKFNCYRSGWAGSVCGGGAGGDWRGGGQCRGGQGGGGDGQGGDGGALLAARPALPLFSAAPQPSLADVHILRQSNYTAVTSTRELLCLVLLSCMDIWMFPWHWSSRRTRQRGGQGGRGGSPAPAATRGRTACWRGRMACDEWSATRLRDTVLSPSFNWERRNPCLHQYTHCSVLTVYSITTKVRHHICTFLPIRSREYKIKSVAPKLQYSNRHKPLGREPVLNPTRPIIGRSLRIG